MTTAHDEPSAGDHASPDQLQFQVPGLERTEPDRPGGADGAPPSAASSSGAGRSREVHGKEVVLLCNPQAGGRWRALAEVLDSPEAKAVRRIVTDEIDDVREALASVGHRAKLLCIYGGDGTIYHIINELLRHHVQHPGDGPLPRLALLGGGTMNVTGRRYGMVGTPGENFRAVMRAYQTDQLRYTDVPVLAVSHGPEAAAVTSYGFTFGLGPLVRILDRYENGRKGKLAALGLGLQAIAATWSPLRTSFESYLASMQAQVTVESVGASGQLELLPYREFCAIFANPTGSITRAVEPFVGERPTGAFHFLAYAVPSREFATLVPLLARGRLPIDRAALLGPRGALRALSSLASGLPAGQLRVDLPRDPRYVNQPACLLRVRTPEQIYTLDGEILGCAPPSDPGGHDAASGQPLPSELTVRLGPSLQLAVRETP